MAISRLPAAIYFLRLPLDLANELTLTGSIGVIMHGWNYRGLMDKVGIAP